MLNLFFFHKITAQSTISPQSTATATPISLTPAMSSSSVASLFSALATTTPQQSGGGAAPGDSSDSGSGVDSDAGASGGSSGGIQLSKAGLIAVIVVIVAVVVFGSMPIRYKDIVIRYADNFQLLHLSCSGKQRRGHGKFGRKFAVQHAGWRQP